MIPLIAAIALGATFVPLNVARAALLFGTIEGSVLTVDGTAIANAHVRATSPSYGTFVRDTDEQGHFLIAGLRPDLYSMDVTAPGFIPARITSIALLATATVTEIVHLRQAPHSARPAHSGAGCLDGSVFSLKGAPIDDARVQAASPSGTYRTVSDQRGHFHLALLPDPYTPAVGASGFEPVGLAGVTVLSAGKAEEVVRLVPSAPREIAPVTRRARSGVSFGVPVDSYAVSGQAARGLPTATSSGLSQYSAGTVLGAVSNLPGITQDQFSDICRVPTSGAACRKHLEVMCRAEKVGISGYFGTHGVRASH